MFKEASQKQDFAEKQFAKKKKEIEKVPCEVLNKEGYSVDVFDGPIFIGTVYTHENPRFISTKEKLV